MHLNNMKSNLSIPHTYINKIHTVILIVSNGSNFDFELLRMSTFFQDLDRCWFDSYFTHDLKRFEDLDLFLNDKWDLRLLRE
jgi:hypothetical protein